MKSKYIDDSKINSQLFHYVIRVPKTDSAFLYFQLEANEGLCFYSTLEFTKGQGHRDLSLTGHKSLWVEFKNLINSLENKIPMTYLIESPPLT